MSSFDGANLINANEVAAASGTVDALRRFVAAPVPDIIARLGAAYAVHVTEPLGAANTETCTLALPPTLERAAPARVRAYLAGRHCAMQSLQRLTGVAGGAAVPVPATGAFGAPQWPTGITGSITHSRQLAMAVVRPLAMGAVGIDCEVIMPTRTAEEIVARVLPEADAVRRLGDPSVRMPWTSFVTAVFSAKESIYKCLNPLTGVFFEFDAVALEWIDIASGTMGFRLRQDLGPAARADALLTASFCVVGEQIVTAVTLSPGAVRSQPSDNVSTVSALTSPSPLKVPAPSPSPLKAPATIPLFFGADERQLFGMYHPPSGSTIRDAGVVLCYSGPQEYTQMHWAYQKLAGLLAAAGFHVMRFDYAGTGDSYGDAATSTLAGWVDDIGTAVSELRDVAGIRRVSLVGARLGAVLALQAVAAGVKVRDIVLWDPVVRGDEYVARLDAAEDFRLRLLNYPEPNVREPDELLGYAFTAEQRAETAAVTLETHAFGRIDRLMLVATTLTAAQRTLQGRAEAEGIVVTAAEVDDPAFHAADRHPNDPVLSHHIPVAISAFLSGSRA